MVHLFKISTEKFLVKDVEINLIKLVSWQWILSSGINKVLYFLINVKLFTPVISSLNLSKYEEEIFSKLKESPLINDNVNNPGLNSNI